MTDDTDLAACVKPLEWVSTCDFHLDSDWCDTFGLYQITDEDRVVLFCGHSADGEVFDSVETAKAAAQADYTRRILSALIPGALVPVSRVEQLEDFVAEVRDMIPERHRAASGPSPEDDLGEWVEASHLDSLQEDASTLLPKEKPNDA